MGQVPSSTLRIHEVGEQDFNDVANSTVYGKLGDNIILCFSPCCIFFEVSYVSY